MKGCVLGTLKILAVLLVIGIFVGFCSKENSESDTQNKNGTEVSVVETTQQEITVSENSAPEKWSDDWLKIKKAELSEYLKDDFVDEVTILDIGRSGASVYIYIPQEEGVYAMGYGTTSCQSLVAWLINNGWDNGITMARVRVNSREAGITGQNLTRQYGMADYIPSKDDIEWKPVK